MAGLLNLVKSGCRDTWRAEEELAVPEFLNAANGSRNVEYVIKIVVVEENRNSYMAYSV